MSVTININSCSIAVRAVNRRIYLKTHGTQRLALDDVTVTIRRLFGGVITAEDVLVKRQFLIRTLAFPWKGLLFSLFTGAYFQLLCPSDVTPLGPEQMPGNARTILDEAKYRPQKAKARRELFSLHPNSSEGTLQYNFIDCSMLKPAPFRSHHEFHLINTPLRPFISFRKFMIVLSLVKRWLLGKLCCDQGPFYGSSTNKVIKKNVFCFLCGTSKSRAWTMRIRICRWKAFRPIASLGLMQCDVHITLLWTSHCRVCISHDIPTTLPSSCPDSWESGIKLTLLETRWAFISGSQDC